MTNSIAQKLGIKPDMTVAIFGHPAGLDEIAPDSKKGDDGHPDLILAFVEQAAHMPQMVNAIAGKYVAGNRLWIAYPKKTGRIKSDITRDNGWAPLAELDLLPVTQIAIDDTWSALRFRYRYEISKLTRKMEMPGAGESN